MAEKTGLKQQFAQWHRIGEQLRSRHDSSHASQVEEVAWYDRLTFVFLLWLLSRLVILVAMLLLAPALPAPTRGIIPTPSWDIFSHWDGEWYQNIATYGYEFAVDHRPHNVAFFPIFPLLARALMQLGLPFPVAGTLINNLAFLSTLMVMFCWMRERYNNRVARWTIAALVWCPLSLYGTVTYTEGLFLLFSTLALRAFDHKSYLQATVWGALTTATRLTGITLIPTFFWVAWRERRSLLAFCAAAGTAVGFLSYSLFCLIHFGTPIAFLQTQAGFGHRSGAQIDWVRWGRIFTQGVVGAVDWQKGRLKNVWHPVQFALIVGSGYLLWCWRDRLNRFVLLIMGFGLLIWLWLLWGDSFVKVWMVFGGTYLVWRTRQQLGQMLTMYGVFSLLLVLFSGSIVSVDRYAFSIITLPIAFGLTASHRGQWNYVLLAYAAIVLLSFSIRFAQKNWVA